jgi:hypothetical protein|tara:strand:+ start:2494 stop:4875 length:2382 start_codon:yes stop_codon:yes gene_type:complete
MITIFRNIKDTDQPFYKDIVYILHRIRDGASKDLIKKIRSEKDKSRRNELKQGLPAICFSGKFSRRSDAALVEHSGFIGLDFDGYDRQKDMLQDKEQMKKNKFVFSVFVSPSGNGLKVIVKIPPEPHNHTNYFNSLKSYFNSDRFDVSCKNVSRVCYESYDPLIHINENSSVWDSIAEDEHKEVITGDVTIPITNEGKIVDILVSWWERKYPMVEGQRNHNIYILAAAFNDFGIQRSLAEYVLTRYEAEDFSEEEIKATVASAYRHVDKFNTRSYEDQEKVSKIRDMVKAGMSRKEIRAEVETAEISPGVVDSVVSRIEEEQSNMKFWTKDDKGRIKIMHLSFKNFLEEHGFYKYNPEGSKNYVFVRVTNNLIDHTSEKEIKDFVLNYLLELEDATLYNYFADNVRYFREEFLTLLASIDVYFIEDEKQVSYLYYRNCAVKITPTEVIPIDYLDLGGYVWKDHVIDRNFTMCEPGKCDFKTFVSNICAKDSKRTQSMESTIGYLMHGHKNMSYCPAVILNDEVISDNPEGGTGKGLLMNALSHMKKLVTIDGKSFTFESSFAYQLVSADTQILCFDDVRKAFNFERLFSVVTEGLTLEKKNKDAIKIPFKKSPKISITTNYAIKGKGNSFERRKWELELHQFYNKDFTPFDEFGRMMFGDWDDDEWCSFDNYMIGCLQLYMVEGLVKSEFVNLAVRKLSAETCHEFIEWCGLIKGSEVAEILEREGRIHAQEMYAKFTDEYPDFAPKAKMTVSRIRFYKWLAAYGTFKYGKPPEEGKDASGRWFRFINDDPPF